MSSVAENGGDSIFRWNKDDLPRERLIRQQNFHCGGIMTLGKLYTDTEGIAYMYIKRGMWTGYYTVYCFKDNTQHQMHRDFLKPVKKCP